MTQYEEEQIFHAIDNMTHHLTTSISEVVEVLGSIYSEIEKIRTYIGYYTIKKNK
jgi:hypothetical protein